MHSTIPLSHPERIYRTLSPHKSITYKFNKCVAIQETCVIPQLPLAWLIDIQKTLFHIMIIREVLQCVCKRLSPQDGYKDTGKLFKDAEEEHQRLSNVTLPRMATWDTNVYLCLESSLKRNIFCC